MVQFKCVALAMRILMALTGSVFGFGLPAVRN
jgi:hypothetical protein